MKKPVKILLIVLGSAILLIAAAIVTVGLMIMDDTDNSNPAIVSNDKSIEVVLNEYLTDALRSSKNDERIALLMSEDETNVLLNAIRKEIRIPFVNVRSMYAVFNDDSTVTFEAPFSFFGFSSLIHGKVDLSLDGAGTIKLKIPELSVGKLSSGSGLGKFILGFVNAGEISSELGKNGVFVDLSLSDGALSAVVTRENLGKTLQSVMGDSGDLFSALADELVGHEGLFEIKFNEEGRLGAVFNLADLKCAGPIPYDLETGSPDMASVKNKMKRLIDAGAVNVKNASVALDFLVRGYGAMSEEDAEIVSGIDFSSAGIASVRLYRGIVDRSELSMAKVMLDLAVTNPVRIPEYAAQGYYDMTVSEENFNELLNSLDFIGTSFGFIKGNESASITIASLYAEMHDNAIEVKLIVDVNGLNCECAVRAAALNGSGALLTLKIESMSLGTLFVENANKLKLLKYLEKEVDLDYLKIDADGETISLDFSGYLSGVEFSLLRSSLPNVSIRLSEDGNGSLIIRMSK